MNASGPLTRIAEFRALAGQGDVLADGPLRAASLLAETWASRQHCQDALDQAEVAANAAQVMKVVDGTPVVVDGRPIGGARDLRGATGGTAFAILDAPDLSKDAELLGSYELAEVAEARYVRRELGAVRCGLTHYRLSPGRRQGFAHRHQIVEEIYVALTGSGRVMVDNVPFDLAPLVAVRVAPGSVRELHAGSDGVEVLAFGTHSPADGEMVDDADRR